MSWILNSTRSMLGFQTAGETPANNNAKLERRKAAAKETPLAEREAVLIRAESLRVKALEAEMKDLTAQAEAGDMAQARAALLRRKELESELQTRRGRLTNLRAQQKVSRDADANLEHALLISEGADELQSTTSAMNAIDLEGAVGRMQEADSELANHNELLSVPIFASSNALIDPDDVDEELRVMMEARRERDAQQLLKGAPTVTRPSAVAVVAEGEKIKEENLNYLCFCRLAKT